MGSHTLEGPVETAIPARPAQSSCGQIGRALYKRFPKKRRSAGILADVLSAKLRMPL